MVKLKSKLQLGKAPLATNVDRVMNSTNTYRNPFNYLCVIITEYYQFTITVYYML